MPPLYPLKLSLAADIEPAAKDTHSPPPQAAGQPERFSRKIHPSTIPGCPKRRGSSRIEVHPAALLRRCSGMLRHHVKPRAGNNRPLVLHHDLGWTPPLAKEVIALLYVQPKRQPCGMPKASEM